ncbi:MAG TPA: hypothetical protein VJH05_00980 [Candidatus Paceibacterota bacterium]
MLKNKFLEIFLLIFIQFFIFGCKKGEHWSPIKENELDHFLKIPPEKMEQHRALAEKLLKTEICPKLQNKKEKIICENLKINTSMTSIGFAYVKPKCDTIYVEPISTIFSESFLKIAVAHELGHVITNHCITTTGTEEIQADLFAAKLFGKEAVIQFLEEGPKVYKTEPNKLEMQNRHQYRKTILALSGW